MKKLLVILPLLLSACSSTVPESTVAPIQTKTINIEILEQYKNKDRFVIDVDIYFEHNSAISEDDATYSQIAAMLKKDKDVRIIVNGHANKIGKGTYNKTLSRERVLTVITNLESKGIPSSRMSFDYFGEDKPRCLIDTSKENPCDRRVTVYLYK